MHRSISSFVLALCALLAFVLPAHAGSWPVAGHDAGATRYSANSTMTQQTVNTLHIAWWRLSVVRAVVGNGRLYGYSPGGVGARLYILDARTGAMLRTLTPASLSLRAGDTFNDFAYGNGTLVLATDYAVFGLNGLTGGVLWRTPGGATNLTIDGQTVYTGKGCQSACGPLASYALSLRTGRVLWTHTGNFGGPPAAIKGRIYQVWGEMGGQTRVFDPDAGELLAQLSYSGYWAGDAHGAYELTPPAGGAAGTFQRIGDDGRPLWRLQVGKNWTSVTPPLLAGGLAVVQSNRFHPGVIAVNTKNGRIVWAADIGPMLSLAAAGSYLAVAQPHGMLTILQLRTGRVLRRIQVNTTALDLLATGDALYVVGVPRTVALLP